MYKSRLQEMCHQKMWAAPDYTVSGDGPKHDPRFRASVAVNGVSFHAPDPSRSRKEAQNKAAEVAVNHLAVNLLPIPSPQTPVVGSHIPYKSQLQTYVQRNCIDLPKYDVVREDESNFYKNLLQQLAQKEGISLPKYNTIHNGACHMPIFSSSVEIGADSFMGNVASTKKQAEMNAAKVAWCKLKERSNTNPASSGSQSKDIKKLELPNPLLLLPSEVKLKYNGDSSPKKQEGGITDTNGSSTVMASIFRDYQGAHLTNITNVDGNEHATKMASYNKLVSEVPKKKENTPQVTFSQDGNSTPSSKSDCSSIINVIAETPEANSSLLCNRVIVYPRKSDMVLPEGATMLPFSDEKWVAVSLDFPNHEDVYQNDEIVIESHGNTASLAYIREEILVNGNDHLNGSDSSFHKPDAEVIEEAFSVDDTSLSSIEFVGADCGIVDVRSDLPWEESFVLYSGKESGRYPSKPDMVLSEVLKKSMIFASQFDSLSDDGLN